MLSTMLEIEKKRGHIMFAAVFESIDDSIREDIFFLLSFRPIWAADFGSSHG